MGIEVRRAATTARAREWDDAATACEDARRALREVAADGLGPPGPAVAAYVAVWEGRVTGLLDAAGACADGVRGTAYGLGTADTGAALRLRR